MSAGGQELARGTLSAGGGTVTLPFYARAAGNHPSVVMYVMSHNATGYDEDMNPEMIDGLDTARDQWGTRNARLALQAEAIVKRLDPRRIVYHHASGNLAPALQNFLTVAIFPNGSGCQGTIEGCACRGE